MNYHINSNEVIAYHRKHRVTRLEAMAILTAKDVGITMQEMNLYMEVFNGYMAQIMTVEDAIDMAVHYVVTVSVPLPHAPKQSNFEFNLN